MHNNEKLALRTGFRGRFVRKELVEMQGNMRSARRTAVKTVRLIWILVFVILLPLSGHAQPPLRIAFPIFPPFHWIDKEGHVTGFFYDIIVEALDKKMGIATAWTVYPWFRCQENLKVGADDAVLTVPTTERGVFTVTHPHPFYQKPLSLYTYVDHPRIDEIRKIETIADIKARGFSVITYSGNGWNKMHVRSIGIETFESSYLDNIWKMLARRRGDIVIEWPAGAWPVIERLGLKHQIIDTGIIPASMPFHLLIRKGAPQTGILAEFDTIIVGMIADGTIQTIIKQYEYPVSGRALLETR